MLLFVCLSIIGNKGMVGISEIFFDLLILQFQEEESKLKLVSESFLSSKKFNRIYKAC